VTTDLPVGSRSHRDRREGVVGRSGGWHDPNYAARRFRATYGISPTEYRRRFAFTTAVSDRPSAAG
jgi:AraC-like DNA-binding protein